MTLPILPRAALALSVTAMSEIRPLMTAGPIDRKVSDRTRIESGGRLLSARTPLLRATLPVRALGDGRAVWALAERLKTASAVLAAMICFLGSMGIGERQLIVRAGR